MDMEEEKVSLVHNMDMEEGKVSPVHNMDTVKEKALWFTTTKTIKGTPESGEGGRSG